MAAVIFLVVTLLAVGLTLPVAQHRGGLASLLGTREPEPEQDAPVEPSPTDPAPEGDGKAEVGAAPPVAQGVCPPDTVRIGATDTALTCIEVGEYPGLREIPRVAVTLAEARSLCAERARRLCTSAQWRRACSGVHGDRFPYGPVHDGDTCNEARSDGTGQNLSRSGARDRCISADGAYDLVGNVGEWVEDGTVLGGDATTRAPSCSTKSQPRPTDASPSTGFRCCVTVPR